MPFNRPVLAKKTGQILVTRAGYRGLLICIEDVDQVGFVALINQVFQNTKSTWFGYVAQDAFPGRLWLSQAMQTLTQKNGALLGFNDGKWFGALAAFGLAERVWASQNYGGAFFYPGYQQHYADTELTVLAEAARRYVYNPHALLIEVDYKKDQKSTNSQDKSLFQSRCQKQFDGRPIPPALLHKFS